MTTLVFGVGYVGSRLIQDLLGQGREVVGVDNLFSTDRRAIDGFGRSTTFHFLEGNVVDPAVVARAFDLAGDVEAVYLLAAQASAHPDAAPPSYTETTNLHGPRVVLDEAARRRAVGPIVFASSLRLYGSPLPPVVDESTPWGVLGDLSHLSKCYVEKLLEMYGVTRGLATASVRLGLAFGVAPVVKQDERFMTAPNLFCWRVARREPLEIRNADYLGMIHVEDAARSLSLAAEAHSGRGYDAYNAAPLVATLDDVTASIERTIATRSIDRQVVARRLAWPVVTRVARPIIHSRLDGTADWPRRSLDEGLAELLSHFLVREEETQASP